MTDITQNHLYELADSQKNRTQDHHTTRRTVITLMVIASFIVNCLSLTGPLFMMLVYDKVLSTYSHTTLLAFCILGLFAYILYGVLDICRKKIISLFAAKFLDDFPKLHNALMSSSTIALLDAPWIILAILALTLLHPYLGAFGCCAILGYIIVIIYQYRLEKQNAHLSKEIESCQLRLSKARLFLRHLPAFDTSHQSTGVEISANLTLLRTQQHHLRTHIMMLNSMMQWIRLVGSSAIIALGAYLALQNLISAGSLIAGSILFMRCITPLESMRGNWHSLRTLYQQLFTLPETDAVQSIEDDTDISLPNSLLNPGTLILKNCVIGDPKHHKPLFRLAELTIPAGSLICLTGQNNAGKTVMLKGLCGIYPSLSGSLSYNKTDLATLSASQMMRFMSYCGEKPYATYLEDTEFTTEDRVLFSSFGLGDPEQYSAATMEIENLSYSTLRKLAIASSFMKQRKLILLDRPSDGLGHQDVSILVNHLKRLQARGTTILVATNSYFLHQQSDYILTLESGRITSQAIPQNSEQNVTPKIEEGVSS